LITLKNYKIFLVFLIFLLGMPSAFAKAPKGFAVLMQKSGDLNLDGITDYITVYKSTTEEEKSTQEHPVKRKMLLILGRAGKSYKEAASNSNALYAYNYDLNFKDALTDIEISNGKFTIQHYGGFATRWSRSDTFEYVPAKKNWFLVHSTYDTFLAVDPMQHTEMTYLPKDFGTISFEKFNIYKMNF